MSKHAGQLVSNILALTFCVCSLVGHFAMERIGQSESPAVLELTETAGQFQDFHDHCEDDLITCTQKVHSNLGVFVSLMVSVGPFFRLPPTLPQLPPPKI
jgi:hypothetical protein